MDVQTKKQLEKIAHTIRGLSIDAIQKANSGHPGLPLGCAEFGAYLYARLMRYNPKDPDWVGRDRFILSAGHGSMLLYSLLHLAGYALSLEEIKQFRQLHSKTPGHPEWGITPGVEATTGPLGQGIANAVGQALGLKLIKDRLNLDTELWNSKVFCLAGDGCIMEGVSAEASSFAGHLQLNNLILIYDCNHITLDGPLSESNSEDTKRRYESYGWDVYALDGYDFDQMEALFQPLLQEQQRPVLVMMRTLIGKGSPHKAGSYKVHGSPLGPEEVKCTKEALGLPEEPFFVPQAVYQFFKEKERSNQEMHNKWLEKFSEWKKNNPALADLWEQMYNQPIPADLEDFLLSFSMKSPLSGRSASQLIIQELAQKLPYLYGGSADLSCSDLTLIQGEPLVTSSSFKGRNIKYGVREFAMGAIASGLSSTHSIVPFVGTFLTFSDYMRNAIRLAALSHIQVIPVYPRFDFFRRRWTHTPACRTFSSFACNP